MSNREELQEYKDELKSARGIMQKCVEAEARNDKLESALQEIEQWSRAYPLAVFPKPDLKKARKLLEAGGMTLDAVSADAMRHVITRAGQIARDALK